MISGGRGGGHGAATTRNTMVAFLALFLFAFLATYARAADTLIDVPVRYPQVIVLDEKTLLLPARSGILQYDLQTKKATLIMSLAKDASFSKKVLEGSKFPDIVKFLLFNRSTSELYFHWGTDNYYATKIYNLKTKTVTDYDQKRNLSLKNQFRRISYWNREKKIVEYAFKASASAAEDERFDTSLPKDRYGLIDPFVEDWSDTGIISDRKYLLFRVGKRKFVGDLYERGYLLGKLDGDTVVVEKLLYTTGLQDWRKDGIVMIPDEEGKSIRDGFPYEPALREDLFGQIAAPRAFFVTDVKMLDYECDLTYYEFSESQCYYLYSLRVYDVEKESSAVILEGAYNYTLPYAFSVYGNYVYYYKFNGFNKLASLYRRELPSATSGVLESGRSAGVVRAEQRPTPSGHVVRAISR